MSNRINPPAPERLSTKTLIRRAQRWEEYASLPHLTPEEQLEAQMQTTFHIQAAAVVDRLYRAHSAQQVRAREGYLNRTPYARSLFDEGNVRRLEAQTRPLTDPEQGEQREGPIN